MKLLLNTILFLILALIYGNNAYPLSDYRIREMCQRKQRKSICMKNLKSKKYKLLKGDQIEIPVIPFKK